MKKIISTLIALNVSIAPLPLMAQTEEEAVDVGDFLLDKAKDAILGQFESLLIDAVFGSSGPQYVNLTEESLNAIQARVHQELVSTAEFEFIAEFESLQSSLNHYSDSASFGNFDAALLTGLVLKANDVVSHHALNKRFNSDYFYMADSYALASTVAMSIYTERHLHGYINLVSVSAKGDEYATKLESMITAKKAADLPLKETCVDISDPFDQEREDYCSLTDPHGNFITGHSFFVNPVDYNEWVLIKEEAERVYYEKHFGRLESAVQKLRSF